MGYIYVVDQINSPPMAAFIDKELCDKWIRNYDGEGRPDYVTIFDYNGNRVDEFRVEDFLKE